ncbi:hypothetical protein ACFWN2_12685 [Lentzea sp. NPDC058436]|uniref:hypothetical protein n=1 Tax=Lentzea sp. NPDC058436 TaxID=3346499 RepID=UPI0036591A26
MDAQAQTFEQLYRVFSESLGQDHAFFGGPIAPRMADMFREFGSGDLEASTQAIARLNDLNMAVGRDYEKLLEDAIDYLDDWEGNAAIEARSWMRGMKVAMGRKRELLDALVMVHKAHHAVIEKLRSDVLQLIDATTKGLQSAGDNSTKLTLAIVGAVAGVIGAFTAGTGALLVIAVGSAMTAGAASVASAAIDGENEAQVLVSMVAAGENIVKAAQAEMALVDQGFAKVTGYLTGDELKWVRPERPKVVTAGEYRPDDFHPEDGYTPQVRDRLPKTDVVTEPPVDEDPGTDRGPFGDKEDRYPEQIRSTP